MNGGGGEAIDPHGVDWKRVTHCRYQIDQTLRYEYEQPIRHLHHRLMIAPRERHRDQERIDCRLWSSTSAPLASTTDMFGNHIASLSVASVERDIVFGLQSTIARRAGARRPDHGDDWADPLWRGTGRLTRADPALLDAAAEIRAAYPSPWERTHAIVHAVHRRMTYTKNVTDVFTTASTAFHMGRGVCQDMSHIAIALARACGIAARYASGHVIGEGATHAWVEFLVPAGRGTMVLSLDPTYCCETDFRYVVVAIGRDYEDVPPTSGVFYGSSAGTLEGRQCVQLVQLTYAA